MAVGEGESIGFLHGSKIRMPMLCKRGGSMTGARSQQICYLATPSNHCIPRVVSRAFLCGVDQSTQQDFKQRRQWMLAR